MATFEDVKAAAKRLREVTESTAYGTPALTVRGKTFCRMWGIASTTGTACTTRGARRVLRARREAVPDRDERRIALHHTALRRPRCRPDPARGDRT